MAIFDPQGAAGHELPDRKTTFAFNCKCSLNPWHWMWKIRGNWCLALCSNTSQNQENARPLFSKRLNGKVQKEMGTTEEGICAITSVYQHQQWDGYSKERERKSIFRSIDKRKRRIIKMLALWVIKWGRELWNTEALEHWNCRTLEYWNTEKLENWNAIIQVIIDEKMMERDRRRSLQDPREKRK